jgi:hypothetical protein
MILVKEFRKGNGRYSTGVVEVLYWDMTIYCDVVILKDRSKVWIKIPQRMDEKDGKRVNILFWASKTISDAFQDEVKAQLAEKFPIALEIPNLQEIRKKFKKYKAGRNRDRKLAAQVVEKTKESFPVGKARSQSKFNK